MARIMNWIFAYGSLMWRPAFDHAQVRKALLRGWRRRFWQASPDHRGVPAAPGRVVTLVRDAHASCWGLAYALHAIGADTVLAALDERERNGYSRVMVELELEDDARVAALCYIAPPDNPGFVGPASPRSIADQIARATGPSGSNLEYLLALADSLTALGVHDEEVHGLRDLVGGLAPSPVAPA
jgi:glutathione-specific gamma-glutamylcyclotransferase